VNCKSDAPDKTTTFVRDRMMYFAPLRNSTKGFDQQDSAVRVTFLRLEYSLRYDRVAFFAGQAVCYIKGLCC
jgi:hypothetical protein